MALGNTPPREYALQALAGRCFIEPEWAPGGRKLTQLLDHHSQALQKRYELTFNLGHSAGGTWLQLTLHQATRDSCAGSLVSSAT
jgi:hypothetical protein